MKTIEIESGILNVTNGIVVHQVKQPEYIATPYRACK